MCLSTRPNILLVTECNLFQKVVEKLLGKDYQVMVAKDYHEFFLQYPHQEIDLGVFDDSDSQENGLNVCHFWREIPELKDVPMVMLTSRASKISKQQADVAYLKQPVDLRQLRKIIKNFIKLRRDPNCGNPKVFVENTRQFISDSDVFRLNYM